MIEAVAGLLREIARESVLPRFERLAREEIEEKSPGELVTVVDREVETALSPVLAALRPGSRVVGEEAAALAPELLDDLASGDVWLLDPLDGTANFVAGNPCFALMVALLRQGECVASWMYSPASGTMCVAEKGGGAHRDGRRVTCPPAVPRLSDLRGAVLTRFLPEEVKRRVEAGRPSIGEILPGLKCAGEDYPRIVDGRQHFAMFWRVLPWDHAPGALFLEEAGGKVARLSGERYQSAGRGPGLLAACSDEVWAAVRRALLA